MVAARTYKDLIVWQKSILLVEEVYKFTSKFPSEEKFGLVSQMRRSVVSIPSNIAEGSRRSSTKDFKNFLIFAFSSGAELETQIIISQKLKMAQDESSCLKASNLLEEVMKMLNSYIKKLS